MIIAIIPAKDEAKNILNVVERTRNYVDQVLVIDDGSQDKTSDLAKSAGALVIRNPQNLGKADSLKIGFEFAIKERADYLLLIDADGQHNPDEIPLFISKMAEGYDIVVGARKFDPKLMPALRIFANTTSSVILSKICGTKILDSQSGYRLLRKEVVERIEFTSKRYQLETEMLVKAARCGFKIGFVEIATIYRAEAKSKINQLIDPIKFLFIALKLSMYKCKKSDSKL
ncbi:MAG: glycosyltransferase family 2 protein [Caldisericaceae bacterium]